MGDLAFGHRPKQPAIACAGDQQEDTRGGAVADFTSDHARSRAMELLAIADPVADDEGSRRLRSLAVRYLEFAEHLDTEEQGRALDSSEKISAELDDVAREFFDRASRGD
jgi:hypothetical protein